MADFAMHKWEINAPADGNVSGDVMMLALQLDHRELLMDIRTELQRLNAKSDAVIQAAVVAGRRSWVRRLLEVWK